MQQIQQSQKFLNPILTNKQFAWGLIAISAFLMLIDNFLKMPQLVGGWHIVMYVLLLLPLLYLVWKNEIKNRYTKWFLPFAFVMIIDMFYYSNKMAQYILPIIFYIYVLLLYITSMHKVENIYQTFLPKISMKIKLLDYIKEFAFGLITLNQDKKVYNRIGVAILITVPFFGIFTLLLTSADSQYSNILFNIFKLPEHFEIHYLLTVPMYFAVYLFLFIFTLSNIAKRDNHAEVKKLDILVAGIFLGVINLLFLSFIAVQIPFLLSENYTPKNITIAAFAREGFFHLMLVLGLVSLIFIFIFKRYRGEKTVTYLLSLMLIQTVIIGAVSLKKMHLYQSLMGATVLRYYVEWFDYFLICILLLGVWFLIRKIPFSAFFNILSVAAIVSFTLIVSLNIDAMVAKTNIEKFKNNPRLLDTDALAKLSIDALPVLKRENVKLKNYKYWYIEPKRDCSLFSSYHYGYCSILKD